MTCVMLEGGGGGGVVMRDVVYVYIFVEGLAVMLCFPLLYLFIAV